MRIALSKHFAETNCTDQKFRVYGILKFCKLNFRGLLKSAKITLLENLDVYGIENLAYMYLPVAENVVASCP